MNTIGSSYLFYKRLFTLAIILFSTTLAIAQTEVQSEAKKRDSLRQAIPNLEGKGKLYAYRDLSDSYFYELATAEQLDTLLTIYRAFEDEAARQGNVIAQSLAQLNPILAFINMGMHQEVIQHVQPCIDFARKHEQWDIYYRAYQSLLKAMTSTGQAEEAIAIAQELYQQAKDTHQEDGISTALHTIAMIYTDMERYEYALPYLRQAIESMENADPGNTTLSLFHYDLCQCLLNLHRYEEAEEAIKTFEKANQREDELHQLTNSHGTMNLLWTYVRFYIETDRYDEAEVYCNKIDSIGGGYFNHGAVCEYRMHIHEARGEYDKALEMVNRDIELSAHEGEMFMNQLQKDKARILSKKIQAEEVFNLMEKVLSVNDSIRNVHINQRLDAVRTQFEVDRHILEKERNRNYMILALAACVLLALALAVWIGYSRRLRAKNRALYEQIQARNQCRIAHEETLISRPREELTTEMRLFRELSLLMKEERLYTDPAINRRALADRLATNERYLAEAIRAGAGETFTGYINQQRLIYALELLITQPNSSIEAIASDAGFNSYPTFHRLFSRTYGMGPSEYRRLAFSKA